MSRIRREEALLPKGMDSLKIQAKIYPWCEAVITAGIKSLLEQDFRNGQVLDLKLTSLDIDKNVPVGPYMVSLRNGASIPLRGFYQTTFWFWEDFEAKVDQVSSNYRSNGGFIEVNFVDRSCFDDRGSKELDLQIYSVSIRYGRGGTSSGRYYHEQWLEELVPAELHPYPIFKNDVSGTICLLERRGEDGPVLFLYTLGPDEEVVPGGASVLVRQSFSDANQYIIKCVKLHLAADARRFEHRVQFSVKSPEEGTWML